MSRFIPLVVHHTQIVPVKEYYIHVKESVHKTIIEIASPYIAVSAMFISIIGLLFLNKIIKKKI